MRNGFVKVSREIFDSEIGSDTLALGLFLYLAGTANWASFNGLDQGQVIVSISGMAERFRVSRYTISRRLALMEKAGILSRDRIGNVRIYRVNKFVEFSGQKEKKNKGLFDFDI